jgi:hypothetical protein
LEHWVDTVRSWFFDPASSKETTRLKFKPVQGVSALLDRERQASVTASPTTTIPRTTTQLDRLKTPDSAADVESWVPTCESSSMSPNPPSMSF